MYTPALSPATGDTMMQEQASRLSARYAADGCAYPIAVLSRAEAADYRARIEAVERRSSGGAPFPYLKPYLALTVVNELVRLPAVLDVVEEIIGPDILVWDGAVIVKEPHARGLFTWHQDLTYWGLAPKEGVVSTWLALSPSTPESGCVKMIPGTHTREILPHRDTFGADNMLSRGQEIDIEVDESQAVDVVLAPGEMSVHHPHLFHRSAPNRSRDRRIGMNVQYIAPGVKQVVGTRDSAMLVRGRDRVGNFEIETPPVADFAPESMALLAEVNERRREYLFQGVEGRRSRLYDEHVGRPLT